jgi:hypothetical protein
MLTPRVWCVVLNWKQAEKTAQCVESLYEDGYGDQEIVVVDNASGDGSATYLRRRFPCILILENQRNLGFAAGCNAGIRRALQEEECRYVFLINNDAEIAGGGLEAAVRLAETDPSIGLVGGKVRYSREDRRLWHAGGSIDRLRGQAHSRAAGAVDRGQFDRTEDVGFVSCGFALVKRAVFERIGLLPEEYFFGQEEWDFSLSASRAGFRLLYCHEFLGFHEGDGSHWNSDPKFVYNSYRNKLIFQQKYLPGWAWPLWLAAFERIYAGGIARFKLPGLHRGANHAEILWALKAAISDHKRQGVRKMTERDLYDFDERLRGARAGLK